MAGSNRTVKVIGSLVTNMRVLSASLILLLSFLSSPASAAEKHIPPYGAVFGQIYDVMEHETLKRRGNVRSVKLRTADRPDDTEELRAEICDKHGLQFITWRSYIRSLSAATARHLEITKEFTAQYGKPKRRGGSAFWTAKGFIVVAKIRSKDNIHQNQIRYFGPKNEPCFEKLMTHQRKQLEK
ncbi:MAG: hypothetical protein HOF23_04855 [Rhodospirillaceae bacterium]|nr:hypothetical protein [Rhodospirillaceae bacterium]MBT7268581.1 hypothetical protein [Rhodospirillaceae bacterium]